jgi:4-hydroxy-tetrahydrodipicolinate synthase
MGPDFIQLSGDDITALSCIAAGAHGCISVVSNVAPGPCVEMQRAADRGDFKEALKLQDRLTPLHAGVFVEAGVTGAKYGLSVLGKASEDVRLPLVPMTETSKAVVRKAMVHAGLINA